MKKLSRLLFAGALSLFLGASMSSMSAATFDGGFGGDYGRFEGEGPMDGPGAGGGIYGPYGGGRGDFGYGGPGYGGPDGSCCFDTPPCCEGGYNNDCCQRFAFGVDYLFWDVSQTGLDVAKITTGTPPTSSVCCDCEPTCRSETEFFRFKGKSGYRLGVSYQLPCWNDVSLNFVFTYFHPEVNKRFRNAKTAVGQESIIQMTTDIIDIGPQVLAGCFGDVVQTGLLRFNGPDSFVATKVKLKYELFDLVLSKNWGCGCWTLTPYAGARVLWVRESLRNRIFGSFRATPTTTPGIVGGYGFAWKTNIPAAGFTAGIHGRYCFCGDIDVIGHFGASVLGGKSKYHNNYYPFNSLDCPRLQYRAHRSQVITGWDGSLGLGYTWNFCSCPIRLGVGYEIQDWFNLPERVRYVNKNFPLNASNEVNPISTIQTSDACGRLTVHGLFVRVAFAF